MSLTLVRGDRVGPCIRVGRGYGGGKLVEAVPVEPAVARPGGSGWTRTTLPGSSTRLLRGGGAQHGEPVDTEEPAGDDQHPGRSRGAAGPAPPVR